MEKMYPTESTIWTQLNEVIKLLGAENVYFLHLCDTDLGAA